MAGNVYVLTDNSFLSALDTKLHRVEQFLALCSGLAVSGLILLAVVSVAGRNLIGQPLPGYVDWIEQIMPLIAFIGIAYTQRNGGHIRMDMLIGQLSGRKLYVAELITTSVILILMLLLVWGTWAHFERSFDFTAPMWSRDSSIDIGLPIWPAKLIVPVAFSVLSVRVILQCCGYVSAIISNTNKPVAVPLIMDAATQAANEAAKVSEKVAV